MGFLCSFFIGDREKALYGNVELFWFVWIDPVSFRLHPLVFPALTLQQFMQFFRPLDAADDRFRLRARMSLRF